ncbi:MAG: PhoH family protein [Planctomycetota bacterium]|jgi:phosphate starvation-inducible PhoH-like protein|nr:PhoH family protein [Planctomycetota bacterium]
MQKTERRIELDNRDETRAFCGAYDRNLRTVREAFGIQLVARDGLCLLRGDERAVESAGRVFDRFLSTIRSGRSLRQGDVERFVREEKHGHLPETHDAENSRPDYRRVDRRLSVRPRSENQRRYVEAISGNDVVFGIGPAGTGKTYLAVAMAVAALKSGRVRRLVLVRPAVEAGERLGFLPGDFQAKINPYLRPLYDALGDILDWSQIQKYQERDIIEIVPLAYMRGRTLNNAFIILDEAQNTTPGQMKMFLTRIGTGARAVITGDITQIDLDPGTSSGLVECREVLDGVEGISFVDFEDVDIVRHPLVRAIVQAYEGTDEHTPEKNRS